MSASRLVLAGALLLAACASASPSADPPSIPAGVAHAWLRTDAGGAVRSAPADATRYTITFEAGGRALLRLDCNRGATRWVQDGASLTLLPAVAATKMKCPDGTLDAAFIADLARIDRWRLDAGQLVLTGNDGTTMRFRALPR
ncbi:hypothetical protein BURK1_00654 [Burkholderiales bacterium]|nr:hypothetical protein BURK1_00654 [Burkholderiales bacterium]